MLSYPLKAFLVMGAATFLTRVTPFLLPRRWKDDRHLIYLGENLPPAIMLLLVVYCLKDADFAGRLHGGRELFCAALVAVAQLQWRHALLSIGLGTGCYVWLLRAVS